MAHNKEKRPLVWIISYFAGGPSYCPRIPDYSLAEFLRRNGYEALVIAGSSLHNTSKNFIRDKSLSKKQFVDGVPFAFIKTRSYIDKKGEILSFIDFFINLLRVFKKFGKPDIVIAAMPQPLSCLAGYLISKYYHIPYITSIVDLWPLSIVEYADFSERNIIIKLMYRFEKWLYVNSDQLVFTWEGAYDYIIDKKWDRAIDKIKFHYINIGVNLKDFYNNLNNYQFQDELLNDERFTVMYCGSIRTANDIGTVVSCAKVLNEKGYKDKIKFVIYGEGPDRDGLIKKCKCEDIDNVYFRGYIDKKYIPYVLSKSNLNILNLKQSSTQKYGNSSNKLFEYLASGNPVIANIDEGNYPIITKYKCGKVVSAGSIEAYAAGIEYFLNMSGSERYLYKKNALETVKLFDTEYLNGKWETIIRNALNKSK